MFNGYRVSVIERSYALKNHKILGRASSDWIKSTIDVDSVIDGLPDIVEVDSIFIYEDSPLINRMTLNEITEEIEKLSVDSCDFGCGLILTAGAKPDEKLKFIEHDDCISLTTVTLPSVFKILRNFINRTHTENGVIIPDIKNVSIGADVKIEAGAVIEPYSVIEGKSVIRSGATIHSFCTITDSEVGADASIGPNAYLRPGSKIGEKCKVGDFVEIKNSVIGNGTKVPHLAYVGDADLGEGINIGCGVIFANYNGKEKFRTVIEDECFIGSNTTLIAPITIGKRSFVSAGATVTSDVPGGSLVIARAPQVNKESRAEKYLKPKA